MLKTIDNNSDGSVNTLNPESEILRLPPEP
jgi:hypothetical protein